MKKLWHAGFEHGDLQVTDWDTRKDKIFSAMQRRLKAIPRAERGARPLSIRSRWSEEKPIFKKTAAVLVSRSESDADCWTILELDEDTLLKVPPAEALNMVRAAWIERLRLVHSDQIGGDFLAFDTLNQAKARAIATIHAGDRL